MVEQEPFVIRLVRSAAVRTSTSRGGALSSRRYYKLHYNHVRQQGSAYKYQRRRVTFVGSGLLAHGSSFITTRHLLVFYVRASSHGLTHLFSNCLCIAVAFAANESMFMRLQEDVITFVPSNSCVM